MKLFALILKKIKKIIAKAHDPQKLAKGFAVGSFIGMMPIPGFQVIVAVFISKFFNWNRYAAAIAVFNTNLYTGLPLFYLNYQLGKRILGIEPEFIFPEKIGITFITTLWDAGMDVFLSLLVGGLFTGTALAIFGYQLMLHLYSKYHDHSTISSHGHTLITGASKGLGKQLALECAKLKHSLILVSLPEEGLGEYAMFLKKEYNCTVECFELDLTDRSDLTRMVEEIKSNFKVNVLINNAGFGGTKSFDGVATSYLDKMISLNISVPVLLTRMLIDELVNNGPSYILNVSSLASFSPMPYKTAYPASKTFIWSFSRGLYQEYKSRGVFVSVAHPGGMATNVDVCNRIKRQPRFIQRMMLTPEKNGGYHN